MSLMIQEITHEEVWDKFVDQIKPYTFLQTWNWGEFHKQMDYSIWRLGIFEEGMLIATTLVLKIKARRGSFLFCPHGPIFSPDPEGADGHPRLLGLLTDHLKALAAQQKCAFIRISPLLPDTSENKQLFQELGFRSAPVHMMHPELAWILDLTPPAETLLQNMRKQTRYSIRKAEKDGVEIIQGTSPADLEHFFKIYEETVKRQHFTPFPRSYFEKELATFGAQNQAQLFFAKYQGDLISTAFIVFTKDAAFYHHGASIHKYANITASHLLQWAVIGEAKKRGCHFYNFWGVVQEDQKNHPWAGLSLFKRGFGGFAESYLHCQDLPISSKYFINFVVETVRRKQRRL